MLRHDSRGRGTPGTPAEALEVLKTEAAKVVDAGPEWKWRRRVWSRRKGSVRRTVQLAQFFGLLAFDLKDAHVVPVSLLPLPAPVPCIFTPLRSMYSLFNHVIKIVVSPSESTLHDISRATCSPCCADAIVVWHARDKHMNKGC